MSELMQELRRARRTSCYQCGKIILVSKSIRKRVGGMGDIIITCGKNCSNKRLKNRKLVKKVKGA